MSESATPHDDSVCVRAESIKAASRHGERLDPDDIQWLWNERLCPDDPPQTQREAVVAIARTTAIGEAIMAVAVRYDMDDRKMLSDGYLEWTRLIERLQQPDNKSISPDGEPGRDGDEYQSAPLPLYAPADETPPDEYPYGPLTGSKTDIAQWILGKRDSRKTGGLVKRKVCWARQDSPRRVSLWFKDQKRYSEANARRIEVEQKTTNGH